jgi:hypothetical protein
MQNNNKEYFALQVNPNGTLKKIYPTPIYKMSYQGLELFCYVASIGQWNVAEKTTGLPIAVSQHSKIDAFKQAREKINAEGASEVIKRIQVAQGGLSNMEIYEENNEE